ncbi:substrate-binding domain-containing protein [Roseateles oligotrophus]|uniref:Substrate-binding domain-containing protein n=1 Tax=Roseateles oligotrophus TaxID=1769250 RepID=A0ABT2YHV5_9BURK|nr:substrate-binding domain-containing protein [Roseateles oligotrophus]MCV2369608.1 substrate-binding domain-containing protein [Roseateles oligotrophus]
MTSKSLRGICSMATRQLLTELGASFSEHSGMVIDIVAVGGVDAARRVQAGEQFDVVVLAADALDGLIAAGHLRADGQRALVDSAVAIAVPAGTPPPDIGSEEALRRSLLTANRIGYSTGPSGTALLRLFERWGLAETLAGRLLQARPGVPVGSLLATSQVDIGFQQLSELQGLDGIHVLGGMPPGLEIVTRFVGAVGSASTQVDAAQELLDFMAAPAHTALKLRHGMTAPTH